MEMWRLVVMISLWIPSGGGDKEIYCVVTKSCVLPCSFQSGSEIIITWYKEPNDVIVHSFEQDQDQLHAQDQDYRERTSLFKDEISRGNASLLLSGIRLTDQARYECYTSVRESPVKRSYINLRVKNPVGPVSTEQSGDVLLCSSENIYFKPNVRWSLYPRSQTEPTTSVNVSEEQLYSVSSSVPLPSSPPLVYTCNISTEHGWRSATYSWTAPVAILRNKVSIPCTASIASIKNLKWTFNSSQNILTRTETGVVIMPAPWKSLVDSVSESGRLTLQNLGPDKHGVYLCELHTDNETFFTKTEVIEQPAEHPSVSPAVFGVSVFFMIIITFAVISTGIFLWRRSVKRSSDQASEEAGLLDQDLHSQLLKTLNKLSNDEFKKFKSFLTNQSLLSEFQPISQNNLETEDRTEIVNVMMKTYGVYSITVTKRVLEQLKRNYLLEDQVYSSPEALIQSYQRELQSKLIEQCDLPNEGMTGQQSPFNGCNTDLFVTMEDTGQVNMEHEIRQIEAHSRKPVEERTVPCEEIFKDQTERGEPIRTVLTKGVAGIGKTVLTQKFSLDWAEGRTNQDIHLLFPFTFRELNRLRHRQFSLVGLLHFFNEIKGLWSIKHLHVVFIFDGLDKYRPPLDFNQTRDLSDPTESGSVDVLLVNLIRRSLLPSARLWITTRSAAANQIPAEYVSMVTEVQGFTDPQKKQYFRFREETTHFFSQSRMALTRQFVSRGIHTE